MFIVWVNQKGWNCLTAGAVLGIAFGALGAVVGPRVGVAGAGFVLGLVVAGVVIIAGDLYYRLRAIADGSATLIGAFLFPSHGGTFGALHMSFEGLFLVALGGVVLWHAHHVNSLVQDEAARKAAAQQEEARLQRITRELPRKGIAVELRKTADGWTATVTNKQGLDFAKVTVRWSFDYGRAPQEMRTAQWAVWKDGESQMLTEKAARLPEFVGFDIEAYPPAAAEPRYWMWVPGRVQGGRWVGVEPPR
jgi:hypothetical protein